MLIWTVLRTTTTIVPTTTADRPSIVSVVLTRTTTAIPIRTPTGRWPTALTPSPLNPRNGRTAIMTATATTPWASSRTHVRPWRATPLKTGLAASTATATDGRTPSEDTPSKAAATPVMTSSARLGVTATVAPMRTATEPPTQTPPAPRRPTVALGASRRVQTPSSATTRSGWTPTGTDTATILRQPRTRTAAQRSSETRRPTGWVARTPTVTPTQTLIQGLPPLTARMPSPTKPHSGPIKTAMATATTPRARSRMHAPPCPARPRKPTVWVAQTVTVTVGPTWTTLSPSNPRSGTTRTWTATGTTRWGRIPTLVPPRQAPQPTTALGARTATETAIRTQTPDGPPRKGRTNGPPTPPNGWTLTPTVTGTIRPERWVTPVQA